MWASRSLTRCWRSRPHHQDKSKRIKLGDKICKFTNVEALCHDAALLLVLPVVVMLLLVVVVLLLLLLLLLLLCRC